MEIIFSKKAPPWAREFIEFLIKKGYITVDIKKRKGRKVLKMEKMKKREENENDK